jgi:adenosylhomocysteine nucleosidase
MIRKAACLAIALALILSGLNTAFAQDTQVTKLDDTPRIAVMSAFAAELQLLLSEAEIETTHVLHGITYHVGTLRGNDVVLFLTGVSMVNAAMTTERALNYFNIERIVFSGIAGGVNPNLHIGDVVVPAQFGQYLESYLAREVDGEWRPPSYWTPEFPNYGMIFPSSTDVVLPGSEPDTYTPMFWFPVDPEMLAVAEEIAGRVELIRCNADNVCLEHEPVIVVGGNGVSGQSFVDNAEFREYVWETFQADALEMETAAVAHVAATHGVPMLAFRSLSDLAGGGPGENEIQTFFQIAADNSALILLTFLEAWAAR